LVGREVEIDSVGGERSEVLLIRQSAAELSESADLRGTRSKGDLLDDAGEEGDHHVTLARREGGREEEGERRGRRRR